MPGGKTISLIRRRALPFGMSLIPGAKAELN